MTDQSPPRDQPSLIGEVLSHLTRLVRHEIDLARAELSQSANRAALAIGLIVAALVVALVALNVLAGALVAAIAAAGLEPGWAALIVGAGFGLIAFLMALKGIRDLKPAAFVPTRTTRNIKRDAAVVRETL
ncbi:MAG: phage holin family protein [Jannaschia sp.]